MTADAAARQAALSPEQSYLVQAPAGSGKTELLVQRYLRLLAVVDAPEEIVALTFTRKAAAEMRQRISAALLAARDERIADSDHARRTAELAGAALRRSAERGWALCDHPGRLRVQTLDSLCAAITRQMPLLSAFGAQPGIRDDASELYLEAAQRTLEELERGHNWSRAIAYLLGYLNNNLTRVAELLAQMLSKRDQWLRFIASRHDPRRRRENLESALDIAVAGELAILRRQFPAALADEMMRLAKFASEHLAEDDAENPIARLRGMRALPEADPNDLADNLAQWQGVVELLQTRTGDWRRQVTVKQGFPPKSAAANSQQAALFADMKQAHAQLMEEYREHAGLEAALARVAVLPGGGYTPEQWRALEALFEMLQLAAANLQLVFRDTGQVDFIEMSARAGLALGDSQQPTDLALALDYRISHLLVDEFQDTSFTQFALLEKLVAEWQPGDGRSLFLVGDPMQSIYRFRQAEVGLYLQVRDRGLGPVRLEFCRLTANFRSRPAVIDWINRVFPSVLPPPAAEDPAAGAISYTPATAQKDDGEGGVFCLAFAGKNLDAEAREVAERVSAARRRRRDASVAILVRSRLHVAHLLPELKRQGLRFQAVDIEALGQQPVIQDLQALTRALLHTGDRLSWLSVLRAPWCGLELADLQRIAGEDDAIPIAARLRDPAMLETLSADARCRLERVADILLATLAERGRRTLRRLVEGCWFALGGPAAAEDDNALSQAGVFLDLLDELEAGGDLADFAALSKRVDELYAPPDPRADPNLHIMTIHRAKGLEFDVVIVPSLGRPPGPRIQPLLFWMEVPGAASAPTTAYDDIADQGELLLAPIAAAGEKDEPIYRYLKSLDQVKTRYEQARLLYVAATRAREALHFLGHLPLDSEDELQSPMSGSLLEQLWPGAVAEFSEWLAPAAPTPDSSVGEAGSNTLRRLTTDWRPPAPPPDVAPGGRPWTQNLPVEVAGETLEYAWAGPEMRHIGTVVHQMLMRISREGPAVWDRRRVETHTAAIAARLSALGIARDRVGKFTARVVTALTKTLEDERGRWLLDDHEDAASEIAYTGLLHGELINVIIDRSFVDNNGVLWIVDYKTGTHEGGDPERFLDREKIRYAPQLQRYAELLAQRETRPIRLGLYFPMLRGWREWPAD